MSVYRIYVEKKPEFAAAAKTLLGDIKTALRLDSLRSLRIINRYDAENISEDNFNYAADNVFSEPAVDVTYRTLPALKDDERVFAVEYLPGQFDQRADSCEQCIQILTQGERCKVRNARVYITEGRISDSEFEALKKYIINPVESREASLDEVETLKVNYTIPETVETLTGFITMDDMGLANFVTKYGLAMDSDDLKFCRDYFRDTEKRDPTITEIRMIDTYWSDHCRHTTFSTVIDEANIDADYIRKTYNEYIDARKELGRENKPITLMDIATIGAKKLKKEGILKDLDESEEINACSVKIKVDVDGELQDWLLMFKNETHNHPTEIEPFGGREYAVRAVPDNLFSVAKKELLMEMIDDLTEGLSTSMTPELIDEKVASLSCKAAVKGNNRLSAQEVDKLIGELLTLDNPYHCPHGRPTIIAMTKRDLEKKFKRIV